MGGESLMGRRVRSQGLTLVELMLVITLVGILGSLVDDITVLSVLIDQVFADTGALPDDLAAIGRSGMKDPWGSAYVYQNLTTVKGKGKARKDHSLVPLNSDYDLYSKGPDKDSQSPLTSKASRDDILRANNGRFIGPAANY